jgi:hypothetical protein
MPDYFQLKEASKHDDIKNPSAQIENAKRLDVQTLSDIQLAKDIKLSQEEHAIVKPYDPSELFESDHGTESPEETKKTKRGKNV